MRYLKQVKHMKRLSSGKPDPCGNAQKKLIKKGIKSCLKQYIIILDENFKTWQKRAYSTKSRWTF